MESAEEIISFLNGRNVAENSMAEAKAGSSEYKLDTHLIDTAFSLYKRSFDEEYGGFGNAPKFPTPHNLLFLMRYYEKSKDAHVLKMVEKTLLQMYRGGMFDHIGGGFSRYSTDRYFLVPHFEKMLYDNALLMLAYCKAYQITGNQIYCDIAEKTAEYVLREMTSPEGGFYCAQDADSEGVEGKYIPNLLQHKATGESATFPRVEAISDVNLFEEHLPAVYEYRKKRYALHLDDKILTSWNGLMIAAMCSVYRVTGKEIYLNAAQKAHEFIEEKLCVKDTLYVSFREDQRGGKGFLDDYSNVIFALLALYGATLDKTYLEKAGGFFLYGKDNEQLILRPKESYDGAVFSGN